ncbi:FMN phosphatase YigB (HAD superfamily) [Paraburkholderia sp. GAS38]|uniref:HAD family hydrolase n=1 Tax=Paraburkholderia sp. GAS38 TaxID=3035133 RepID=UPI003D1AA064
MNPLLSLLEKRECLLLSIDAFDTLLLRKPLSLDRRLLRIARLFCSRLGDVTSHIDPRDVAKRRREVERLAFRARDVAARGEVRLTDIAATLLQHIGIDEVFVPDWIACEMAVERASLFPNRSLIRTLRQVVERGIPVRVVSDTTLGQHELSRLISDVCPDIPHLDDIHTSADMQLTKRDGTIFASVASAAGVPASRIVHLGDDLLADCTMPRRCGLTAVHRPRHAAHVVIRRADAAIARAFSGWHASRSQRVRRNVPAQLKAGTALGSQVLGPIFAEYCRRLHVYLKHAALVEGPIVALFCARGGLGLERLYREFASQFPLSENITLAPLMVSRLIAARDALVFGGEDVVAELEYEFGSRAVKAVAQALSATDQAPSGHYTSLRELIHALRNGAEPDLWDSIAEQAALFREMWRTLADGKSVVLCDTGLYGSTYKLLEQSGLASDAHCVLLARSDYKGLGRQHFSRVTGLLTERNGYRPGDSISSILAFWHLIESIVEPDLQSVRRFSRGDGGSIVSNLETEGWRNRVEAMPHEQFAEVKAYIRNISTENSSASSVSQFQLSARLLEQVVMFPDIDTVNRLGMRNRSIDFGREATLSITHPDCEQGRPGARLVAVRRSLWPSGAAVKAFPQGGQFVQFAIRLGYSVRPWIK